MSKVQKLSIALPKAMTVMVNKAVKKGQYASVSEVVRDALRTWQSHEKAKANALTYMRSLIQEGIDSRPAKHQSMDAIIAEAKRRHPHLAKKSA
jgi:antitoxin ParD1/3/4